jgi:hypothetical protein
LLEWKELGLVLGLLSAGIEEKCTVVEEIVEADISAGNKLDEAL